ncbi:MAG: RusA family crossover junction endodeoxyribonuclease [Cyanobacteria bacterium P01_D01_bin.73]
MTYSFTLTGAITPKARPRVTRNGTFMPRKYREWKTQAITSLQLQWSNAPPISEPVGIEILLTGKHPRRGDSDNVAGAILDALQDAGVLKNDNLKAVPRLAIQLKWDKDRDPIATVALTAI